VPLAAADKVNDLYAVTGGQSCLGPLVAANYFVIEFDGDSRRCQSQFRDEVEHGSSLAHFPALTIEFYLQIIDAPLQEDSAGRMIRRSSAVSPSMCAWISTAARPLSNDGSRIGIAAMP